MRTNTDHLNREIGRFYSKIGAFEWPYVSISIQMITSVCKQLFCCVFTHVLFMVWKYIPWIILGANAPSAVWKYVFWYENLLLCESIHFQWYFLRYLLQPCYVNIVWMHLARVNTSWRCENAFYGVNTIQCWSTFVDVKTASSSMVPICYSCAVNSSYTPLWFKWNL